MSGKVSPRPVKHSGGQKITLIVLGVVALATVFLLPMFISEPLIFGQPKDARAPPPISSTAVAPSTAAEKTKYRQDSQALLAQIIAVRDRLVEQNVDRWAAADFQQALKKIEAGDEEYNFGEYRESLDDYQQALEQFTQIEERGKQMLARSLADGFDAVESLNTVMASESVDLATAIAPHDPRVQNLAGRAAILPELADVIEQGDVARDRGELEAARAAYERAVRLDPAHRRAAASLNSLGTEITDSIFNGHMSRGLAALERGDWEGARAAFHDADTVYSGHSAVQQGLAQVENRKSLSAVNQRIKEAAALEGREEWQQAVEVYEALLAEDPSLTGAKVKLIPSRVRADLDARLSEYIEEPLSLANATGYREGQLVLTDARSISNPGPRLTEQIITLEDLLVAAVSIVEVVFQSDNLTHVVLFRVAELGQFEQTSVKLRPGRYVVAGTRKGFRDVRVEFTVTGKPLDKPIVVRCEEPI